MSDFSISGNTKVKTLKANFKKEFGSTLRVYSGVKFAADDDTVASIAKVTITKGSDVSANGHKKVGTFEKEVLDVFGIKVQVASPDDTKLVDNELTLSKSGKV